MENSDLSPEKIVKKLYPFLVEQGKYALDDVVHEASYGRGEYVYLPGASPGYIYEIVTGTVKLGSYSIDEKETIYEVLSTGDFFGNLRYLDQEFFEFSKTLVPTTLRVYKLPFFRKLIKYEPEVSDWFNYRVVNRWWRAETKLFHIRGSDQQGKLQMVYNILDRHLEDAKGKPYHVFSLLTQKDIGDLIGATRQTVSNVLHEMVEQGKIKLY